MKNRMKLRTNLFAALLLVVGCGRPAEPPQATPGTNAPADTTPPGNVVEVTLPTNVIDATAAADPVSLDAVVARIRALEQDADFTAALTLCRESRAMFRDSESTQALAALATHLLQAKREASELLYAVEQLGAAQDTVAHEAAATLRRAGDTGLIFLRLAVRDAAMPIAAGAAAALGTAADTNAVSILLDRLARDGDPAFSRAVGSALADMQSLLSAAQLTRCHGLLAADKGMANHGLTAPLARCFAQRCERDVARFNTLLAVPDAYTTLRLYVERMLSSGARDLVARACADAIHMDLSMDGLQADYFENARFAGTPTATWIDAGINYQGSRGFPTPNGRQDDLAIRWQGLLRVPRAGDYRVFVAADDSATLIVDDKTILETAGWREVGPTVTLTPGPHTLRLDYTQTAGDSRVYLAWEGAGFGKTFALPLHAYPRPDDVLALTDRMTNLVSEAEDRRVAAFRAVRGAGDVGRALLYRAIRDGHAALALAATRDLVVRRDPRVHLALLARLATEASDSPIVPELTGAARDMAAYIDAPMCNALLARIGSDAEPAMPFAASVLCGVLQQRCGGSAPAFDAYLAEPDAFARLSNHVARAAASADSNVVIRAAAFGTPFVPDAKGLQGVCFDGYGHERLVAARRDAHLTIANNAFPHPTNRQDNVSARWSGFLNIPTAGDYLFHGSTRESFAMELDGNVLLDVQADFRTGPIHLEAGLHPLRALYRQGAGDRRLDVNIEGSGVPRQRLADTWLSSPPSHAEASALAAAVQSLAAADAKTVAEARARLMGAGDTGRTFLRFALRHMPDAAAGQALDLLAILRDEPTADIVVERLRRDAASPFTPRLLDALVRFAGHLGADNCAWLAAQTKVEDVPAARPWLAILMAILERKCNGDAKAFDALAATESLHDRLAALAERMLSSADPATVDWACEHAGPFAPLVPGCRGRYFEGAVFDRLVTERRDSSIRFDKNAFPHTTQDHVSAAWRGQLRVETPGEYAFWVRADDGQRLWVDDRLVVDTWENAVGQERWGQIALDKGWRSVEVIYRQTVNDDYIDVHWQGPGIGRQSLSPAIHTRAWPAELAVLRKHIQDLASKDANVAGQAKTAIRAYGDLGTLFLRNATRHATGAVADEAAKLLPPAP